MNITNHYSIQQRRNKALEQRTALYELLTLSGTLIACTALYIVLAV